MNRQRGILSLCLLGAVLLLGCSVEVPEQIFIEGMNALNQEGNFIYALVQFDKFLSQYPDHEYAPTVLLSKARCHWALKEYEEALAACDRAAASYGGTNKEIEAVFMKCGILQAQDRLSDAIEILEQLRGRMSGVVWIYQDISMQLAGLYERMEQPEKALAVYDALIDSTSVEARLRPTVHILKGKTLARQGREAEARATFDAIGQQFPGTDEAIWANVEISRLMQKEDPESAEAYLQEAIEAFRQMAKAPEAATGVAADATTAVVGAVPGMTPGGMTAPQRELLASLGIVRAYAYTNRYDQAIELLEDLKNRYLQDPQAFQAITMEIQEIRRQQQSENQASQDAQAQEAMPSAATAVRSVSP